MHLLSLNIRNFRVIKETRLQFPDNIIGVIGPNGAGKSSLIEAIAWALYGNQAARSGKDEIKATFARSTDDCEVELTFRVNGEAYRVLRRLVGKTERAEVELYRASRSESVGSMETQKHISHLLGLDWRGFLTSFLARQQELNALSDLVPSKRREHLAGMLGIEKLDRALQQLKEDNRASGDRAAFLQRQLLEKEQVQKRIEELSEHEKRLADNVATTSGAYEEKKRVHDAISLQYKREHDKLTTCSAVKARIDAGFQTRKNLEDLLAQLTREQQQLAAAEQEFASLQTELIDFGSLKARLEGLKEAQNKIRFRKDLAERRDTLLAEQTRLSVRLSEIERAFQQSLEALNKIPEHIESLKREVETALGQARDDYSALKARLESANRDIDRVQNQIVSINEIGPDTVCDRCHRPYGDDLPEIKKHLDRELVETHRAAANIEKQLTTQKNKGLVLKQEFETRERQLQQKFELNLKKETAEKEVREVKTRLDSLARELAELTTRLEDLSGIEFDEMEFERLGRRLPELEKKQARQNRLGGMLESIPAVRAKKNETQNKITELDRVLQDMKSELTRLDFDETAFERVRVAFDMAVEEFERCKTVYLEAKKERELTTRELELLREQLAGFARSEKELEQYRSDQYYREKLSGLFSEFRKHVIARIRPQLARISGGLLEEMTDGRFRMVELDENYNLRVMDYGHFFGVERFSGGEKDLANLCLRLAISLALTESAGLDRSFVILDEVFGSQDNDRRELIFKGLANLKKRFPQMFLITHIDELKDRVETLIEVNPTGAGWSEVKIDGVAV
ncbi:MAG: AAA family ATPase [Candidatus Zixiibacteriota bacterium]